MAKTKFKSPKINFAGTGAGSYQPNPFLGKDTAGTGIPQPPPPPVQSFQEILAADPFYQAALANLNAAGVYDKASRDQAIKQAMIRFGFAPEAVAGMTFPEPVLGQPGHNQPRSLADILDPTTRSLAQQNTDAGLSIWARLLDAQNQQQKRTVDVLGSRGLFRSGETGYQLKRGVLAADQARYDATNKLMDFLTGAQAAYVQAEMQRQALLLQAQQDAAEKAAAGGGTGGTGTGSGGKEPEGGHKPGGEHTPPPKPGPQTGKAPAGPGTYQPNPFVTPQPNLSVGGTTTWVDPYKLYAPGGTSGGLFKPQ